HREAAVAFTGYLADCPEDADAWYNLGMALFGAQDPPAAAAAWERALAAAGPQQRELLQALFDAADELCEIQFISEALGLFRALLDDPQLGLHACQRLSWNLHKSGLDKQALEVLDQAVARWPANPGFRLNRVLQLPLIYPTRADMLWWRRHLLDGLTAMESWLQTSPELSMTPMQLHSPIFNLMPQGEDEKPVLQRISAIWQRLFVPPQPLPAPSPPRARPRLALVSVTAYNHSTMHYFIGMLEMLAQQTDFETAMFYFGTRRDDYTVRVSQLVDYFVHQAPSLSGNRDAISAWQPDILFYLDIGQEALLYTLAHLRLAPVQCVSAGIPITTGIPAMDYYLSSQYFESVAADAYYSETLIRLEHPMVCMRPPGENKPRKSRRQLGLPEAAHLYIFPHTLIRVDPELDDMLAQILNQDDGAEIVFIQDLDGQIYRRLQERFGGRYPELLARLRFLPPMEQPDFLNVLACCDVALDGLRLGGGNVSFQCFWVGTPIIHCPTPFLRCRIAAGLYRLAGLEAWIAHDWDDYVAKALQLGRDPQLRERLSQQLLAARPSIFNRREGIEEIFACFRRWAASARAAETGRDGPMLK
ncbi:MAG: hypothetical protein ACAI44_19970, partial [Candidatus Sericytochromatia bacterium]